MTLTLEMLAKLQFLIIGVPKLERERLERIEKYLIERINREQGDA